MACSMSPSKSWVAASKDRCGRPTAGPPSPTEGSAVRAIVVPAIPTAIDSLPHGRSKLDMVDEPLQMLAASRREARKGAAGQDALPHERPCRGTVASRLRSQNRGALPNFRNGKPRVGLAEPVM